MVSEGVQKDSWCSHTTEYSQSKCAW